jgi:RHS repeat-associated protein
LAGVRQNRASKTIGGVTDSYTYDSHDKLTSTSSKSYGYDSDGNCTSVTVGGSTTTLTYDDADRVTGITYPSSATNSFVYNGEDLRVSKTDSAGTSAQITDGTSPASPVLKDARAVYTPGISERAGSASKFYHGDALGSARGITNSSQTVTDAVLYDAFGMTVSRTGTTATPFGFVGAQGYQSDGDSGLQLLGHRYYDPSIGRFLSSDPAQAGTNWYAYTENNPLGGTDPSGLDLFSDIGDALGKPLSPVEKGAMGASTIIGGVGGILVGGGGGALGGTAVVPGVGTVAGGAAGALQGGAAGAGLGTLAGIGTIAIVRIIGGTLGHFIGGGPGGGQGGGGGGQNNRPGGPNQGKTVDQILKERLGKIRQAPLDPGSPSWRDIGSMPWEEIVKRAKAREIGFDTIKKLLTDGRFKKP